MADAIEDRKDEIGRVESQDNGKTPFEATLDIDTFRYYASWTDKIQGDEVPVPGDRLNYTVREPIGVTGHVSPWNYPFQLAGRSLAPALACGNTAVLKPSSTTPLSALYYAVAAEETDIPDGVLNVVPGRGSVAGNRLTEYPDVSNEMMIAREEIFGPVLSVISFSDREEAIEIANDSPYGLMAGIWTSDLKTAHTVADSLDYGMVSVNEFPVTQPQTPFGGFKQSGYGREQGTEAIHEYTQTKNVNVSLE